MGAYLQQYYKLKVLIELNFKAILKTIFKTVFKAIFKVCHFAHGCPNGKDIWYIVS